MIFCEGMFIVIVRRVTLVICSKTGMRIIKPGPRTPVYLPKKKMTPRSYSFTTRSERNRSTTTTARAIMMVGMVFTLGRKVLCWLALSIRVVLPSPALVFLIVRESCSPPGSHRQGCGATDSRGSIPADTRLRRAVLADRPGSREGRSAECGSVSVRIGRPEHVLGARRDGPTGHG